MNHKIKSISILGCGWLGLPLASQLIRDGYQVSGSTTHPDKINLLKERGIKPFLINLSPTVNADCDTAFFDSELLILNIPPSRKRANIQQFYSCQVEEVLRLARKKTIKAILMVSATSVYPDTNQEVKEDDIGNGISQSGQALLQAERVLQYQSNIKITVLRFCGLYNSERNPGRFLAGRQLSSNGKDKVNLIHLDDCIGLIRQVISKGIWGEVFNACSEQHPEKEDFYTMAAQKLGLEAPRFDPRAKPKFKIVNSQKLTSKLKYSWLHPDPYRSVRDSESGV